MEGSDFSGLLERLFRKNGLESFLQPATIEKFAAFTELLLSANKEQNLTAIRDLPGIVGKHYADCLLCADLFPQGASVLDVGCGGGFPTIPLGIARPDLHLTAIDSTGKKVAFVARAAKELGLEQIQTVCGRIEDAEFCRFREQFDVVTARAVANLRVLSELTLPFVKRGGRMIGMKGAQGEEELRDAREVISKLGGEVERVEKRDLICVGEGETEEKETRTLILIRKIAKTPEKYPRAYAAIKKGFV